MVKIKLINEALQQMAGFKIGIEQDIIMLVDTMGLTKEEWKHIKSKEDSGNLFDSDIKKIDEYFALLGADE